MEVGDESGQSDHPGTPRLVRDEVLGAGSDLGAWTRPPASEQQQHVGGHEVETDPVSHGEHGGGPAQSPHSITHPTVPLYHRPPGDGLGVPGPRGLLASVQVTIGPGQLVVAPVHLLRRRPPEPSSLYSSVKVTETAVWSQARPPG